MYPQEVDLRTNQDAEPGAEGRRQLLWVKMGASSPEVLRGMGSSTVETGGRAKRGTTSPPPVSYTANPGKTPGNGKAPRISVNREVEGWDEAGPIGS